MTPVPANLPLTRLAWFPLINRPRPPARPVAARIAELRDLLTGDGGDRLTRAAEALNKAALIASDCGCPDLARTLCWRQYELFDRARPLPAAAAKLALQPILNLPRQLIRDGDPGAAHALLQDLHHAAEDHSDLNVDGRTVHLRDLARDGDDHQALRALVWTALLADGTRALTAAGRWHEAAQHAAAHRGIGHRLLDGRQTTILALLHNGSPDQAEAMVEASTIKDPWEHAVQAILQVLCQRSRANGAPKPDSIPQMLSKAHALITEASSPVFRVRAVLTALELAGDDARRGPLPAQVLAAAAADARAAKDALTHPVARHAPTARERQQLETSIRTAGLEAGRIPQTLTGEFETSVTRATEALHHTLQGRQF